MRRITRDGLRKTWGLVTEPTRSLLKTGSGRMLLIMSKRGSKSCFGNYSANERDAMPLLGVEIIGTLDVKTPKEMGLRMPQLISAGNTFVLARTSPPGADSANLFHNVAWGGDFYVLLDPGKYKIVRVEGPFTTLSRSGNFSIPVDLPFEVPENKVIYIGAIEMKFTLTLAGKIEDLKVTVLDKYDDTVKKFREKYPFIGQPVENQTMKMQ